MNLELKGLKEVEASLNRLGKVAGAKVMRQSLFAASKPLLDQARRNVEAIAKGSGALHLALGRTFRVKAGGSARSGSRFTMYVGPRIKVRHAIALHNLYYKRRVRGIFYGHLVEFGHRIGNRKTGRLKRINRPSSKGAMAAGFVRPQRFLGPALQSKSLQATFIFTNQVRKRVERALKKLDPAVDRV